MHPATLMSMQPGCASGACTTVRPHVVGRPALWRQPEAAFLLTGETECVALPERAVACTHQSSAHAWRLGSMAGQKPCTWLVLTRGKCIGHGLRIVPTSFIISKIQTIVHVCSALSEHVYGLQQQYAATAGAFVKFQRRRRVRHSYMLLTA